MEPMQEPKSDEAYKMALTLLLAAPGEAYKQVEDLALWLESRLTHAEINQVRSQCERARINILRSQSILIPLWGWASGRGSGRAGGGRAALRLCIGFYQEWYFSPSHTKMV